MIGLAKIQNLQYNILLLFVLFCGKLVELDCTGFFFKTRTMFFKQNLQKKSAVIQKTLQSWTTVAQNLLCVL